MNNVELLYQLDTLKEQDPNYVVDVLNISSEVLVDTFLSQAIDFIKEDQGE